MMQESEDISFQHVKINQLFVSFGLLTSHFFSLKSKQNTAFINYYLRVRSLGFHGSTPLIKAFDTFDPETQLLCSRIILFTPLPQLGCFGGEAPLKILQNFRDQYKQSDFKSLGVVFKKLLAFAPELKAVAAESDNPIKRARKILAKHPDWTVHAVNKSGTQLARLTKVLFELASKVEGKRKRKFKFHQNLLMEPFLTADLTVPKELVDDLNRSYVNTFSDFVPLSIFLTTLYQNTLGLDWRPNLGNLGTHFGFNGYFADNFNYLKRHNAQQGTAISDTFNLYYEQVCKIQQEASSGNVKAVSKGLKGYSRNYEFNPSELTYSHSPFYKSMIGDDFVTGMSEGRYIVDRTNLTVGSTFEYNDLQYQFPFSIRLLTNNNAGRNGRSSLFTDSIQEKRAFSSLVKENPITKPNLDKRKKNPDKKWSSIFDEYLKTDFSLEALVQVMKKDIAFFRRVKPTLKQLRGDRYRDKYYIEDIYKNDDSQISPEDTELFSFYETKLDEWVLQFKNKTTHARIQKLKLKRIDEPKSRIVCSMPAKVSLFQKFINRIFQVVYQTINKNVLDYSISNYLPGMAVPLYTMEKFKERLPNRGIDLLNLDVKACFDNINILHPNFDERLDLGIQEVDKLVSSNAGNFLRKYLKDYLINNVKDGKFNFVSESLPEKELPKPGSLPTGFVLSPAVWLLLALPAVVKTQNHQNKGNLLGYDLCGDDLIGFSNKDLPLDIKEDICKPWFELTNSLDLNFHFFKNYTDKRVPVAYKWEHLFTDKKIGNQNYNSAWIKNFPARSIPIFHGGSCLARRTIIENVTSLSVNDDKKTLAKFYMALHKRRQHGKANFVPSVMAGVLSPILVSRFSDVTITNLRPKANRRELKEPVSKPTLNNLLYGDLQYCGKHFEKDRDRIGLSKFKTLQTGKLYIKTPNCLHLGRSIKNSNVYGNALFCPKKDLDIKPIIKPNTDKNKDTFDISIKDVIRTSEVISFYVKPDNFDDLI